MRFRPILMTTMAALLGGVPMMIGTGVGRRSASRSANHCRRPRAVAAADALHDAGGLYLSGSAAELAVRGRQASPRTY